MADADSSGNDLVQLSDEELDALASFGPGISEDQVNQLGTSNNPRFSVNPAAQR